MKCPKCATQIPRSASGRFECTACGVRLNVRRRSESRTSPQRTSNPESPAESPKRKVMTQAERKAFLSKPGVPRMTVEEYYAAIRRKAAIGIGILILGVVFFGIIPHLRFSELSFSSTNPDRQNDGETRSPDVVEAINDIFSVFGAGPVGRTETHVVGKECAECGKPVSLESKAGDKCPHCGVRWDVEAQTTRQ
jgi:DNA-directed RNA polymerase subunit RPC12/RpoP